MTAFIHPHVIANLQQIKNIKWVIDAIFFFGDLSL